MMFSFANFADIPTYMMFCLEQVNVYKTISSKFFPFVSNHSVFSSLSYFPCRFNHKSLLHFFSSLLPLFPLFLSLFFFYFCKFIFNFLWHHSSLSPFFFYSEDLFKQNHSWLNVSRTCFLFVNKHKLGWNFSRIFFTIF